jgi:membrane protein
MLGGTAEKAARAQCQCMPDTRLAALQASRPGQFVQKFMDDRALTLASLVAWGMLNTFLPLLLGVLSLIGLVLGDSPAAAAAEATVLAPLPPEVGQLVRDSMASIGQVAGVAGLISLGLLLFNGSNFFVTLESVFDLTYHVPERDLITQRVVSFAALFVLTGLVLIGSVAAVVGGVFGEGLASLVPTLWATVDTTLAAVVSLVGLFVAFLLMYWVLPNTRVSLRQALPGAVVAAALFVAVLRIFPIYIALFGGGFSVYAAFGTVLVFMFWLYIVGVVVVGGAVLNAFLRDPKRSVALASLAARALTGKLELPT